MRGSGQASRRGAGEGDGRGQLGDGVTPPEGEIGSRAMGTGAVRMFGWAVGDAPVRAPDGQGVDGNAAQISKSWGED